jgi:hypothetical protein
VRRSAGITISEAVLNPAANDIPYAAHAALEIDMRELSAEARLHLYARSVSRRSGTGLHTAALYSAFALIAAIVFGTLSVHPF